MKTDTGDKILAYIRQKGQTTPKELIGFIGFSAPAVFRQLKKLQEDGLIQKSGTSPFVFYHLPMSAKDWSTQGAIKWAYEQKAPELKQDYYCETRDVFQARQDKLPKELIRITNNEQISFLLSAVVGEIGNNSFDHNLGNWPDVPGIFFKIDVAEKIIILADRGQGIFMSLQKIKPEIKNYLEALEIAFTEIISGRTPEHRGNGLKFVKRVIEENNLKLKFYSGDAKCLIEKGETKFLKTGKPINGALAVIEF
ncbi:MAG: hypothetical protein US42_C0008G0012 [Candidatus Magasanikbacteria bacterium GW2011_GWC2_37_14]|uniref:HTH arsR-type domain-containing protein n=1 Tax=Candidatus Magasanikbacteria bacterium GW2011_GWC2_37_14 TaxID=1619046 RepID=A0A0G0JHA6_9BACT|nr:MAG: hypothetical protein US42_C0008G0012 [Candidatus Magasanikbacteria bacterium GW2011_GWC2_37_14]